MKKKESTSSQINEIEREYLPIVIKETLNGAVLDCGCVRSVCGKKWLVSYVKSLAPDNVKSVQEVPSHTRFRFGVRGPVYQSEKRVKFQATIGTRKVFLEAGLIDCDSPSLLSKGSMKKADTQIKIWKADDENDEVTMLGQKLKLKFTSSGHYAIPLMGHYSEWDCQTAVKTVFLRIEEIDPEMKTKACKKLHIQFGHPHTDRLHGLLKDAKVVDKEVFDLVADVEKACDTCNRFKNPKLRPVVGFALARGLNDLLAMDLKPYNNVHILHMIDHAT